MSKRKFIPILFLAAVLMFLYLPILILALYSFTDSTTIGAIRKFSISNYIVLFSADELRSMILGTLLLALSSSLLATFLGTIGAIGAFYSRRFIRSSVSFLNQVPIINADVVTGFSICILLIVALGIDKNTFIPLVAGHTILSAPFVYLSVLPKLKQMDESIYEAALDLGANSRQALFKVLIPHIASGILSGFLLSITLSLDDYFIATYTKPTTFDTISTYVVNATKGAQTEIKTALWALSTLIFLVVVIVVLLMNISNKRKAPKLFCLLFIFMLFPCLSGCGNNKNDEALTLRICNWQEYIDYGDWDEEEAIDLDSHTIMAKQSMLDDFCDWYEKKYGKKIKIEYSTFGSNEELYNQMTLGDTFDLVCPSEYMIMKLMAEDKLEPFSDDFRNTDNPENYYQRGVSPYIKNFVKNVKVKGESIDRYAAGYMWGTTGIVYNPEYVTEEEASSWKILTNPKFRCQVTMKDNVRDAYFAAMGIYKSEKLHDLYMRTLYENNTERSNALLSAYPKQLKKEMNDTSLQTIKAIETILRDNRNNFYSFESDSGKSDMVTGKVVANLQWSGDGVYSLDQAEEDGIYLNFSVPYECSNLWFDGWVMCKKGLEENAEKKQACEAFVNFLSMPDNVVRNMQYVGYTSVIAGYEDDTIFEYIDWCYGAPEEQTDVADYDISAFFGRNDAVVTTSSDQLKRQLYAQYPPKDVLDRCAIMEYLDDETTKLLNQMWINVRCYKLP